jgi:hypothetical protein
VIDLLRDRALFRARDKPRLAGEGTNGFEGESRPSLVRDRNERVGVGRVAEQNVEGLHRAPTSERRVERRATAGEEGPCAVG